MLAAGLSRLEVVDARSPEQLEQARGLIRALVAWHRRRHVDDLHLIDAYFDEAKFEAELAGLPGAYEPLLLATVDGEAAGCVALRRLDRDACEMKRMYVDERFRGLGAGRALTERVLSDARALGYRAMRLDTSVRQTEALTLYRSSGFEPVEPYYDVADELRGWLVFMERTL